MRHYTVEVSGLQADYPTFEVETITEGRKLAESYGDQADKAHIYDSKGREVALHVRDRNGNGRRWFKATL